MTRRLASLADLTYRRRGRVVIAWIVAIVATIGIGIRARRRIQRRLRHAGLGVPGCRHLTKEKFSGYSGQEIYVVWKDRGGRRQPAVKQRLNDFFAASTKVEHISAHTPIRVSDDGTIATTTLPMTVPGWEMEKEQGEQLIAAAESNSGDGLEIKLGGDVIYQAQGSSSPEGIGFLGAAIVLLIAFGSIVAAGLPLGSRWSGWASPRAG